MNNDGNAFLKDESPKIFQIGERVVLNVRYMTSKEFVLPFDYVRRFDSKIGQLSLSLFQIRLDNDLDVIRPYIGSFFEFLNFRFTSEITDKDWNSWLTRLFGTVAGLFKLKSDTLFLQGVSRLIETSSIHGRVHVFEIEGNHAKVATTDLKSTLETSDLLVLLAEDRLIVSSLESIEPILASRRPRQKIVGFRASGNLKCVAGFFIGEKGIRRLELTGSLYEDFESFYHGNELGRFDQVALMERLSGLKVRTPAIEIPENTRHQGIEHSQLGVQFRILQGLSLKHGFFASGWVLDPEEAISEVVVVDHTLVEANLMSAWKSFYGQIEIDGALLVVKRFVVFLPRRDDTKPPLELRIRVTVGRDLDYVFQMGNRTLDCLIQRQTILDSIAEYSFSADQFNDVFRPAIGPLQKRINDIQAVREKREFGTRSTRSVSIVIPIHKETAYLRSQLIAFSLDNFIKERCEIIYCVDDPNLSLHFIALMTGFAAAFNLDVKVVSLSRNGGYSIANNIAAENASGSTLVLLNSDVVPTKPGWVEEGITALAELPAFSLVGAKLIYPDKTLQHAGMYFERSFGHFWQNVHFYKGFSSELPTANIARDVPAVTGACMFIRRSDFFDVGGFSDDYIYADFEDSDLCLKLHEHGGRVVYRPSIELYHLEAQSRADGYGFSDASSSIYNRAFHTAKWGSVIPNLNQLSFSIEPISTFA